jgi:hypothetical protein
MSKIVVKEFFTYSPDGYTNLAYTQGNTTGPEQYKLSYLNAADGYATTSTFTTLPIYVGSLDSYLINVFALSGSSPNFTITPQGCCDPFGSTLQNYWMLQNWFGIYYTNQATGTLVQTGTISAVGQSNGVLIEDDRPAPLWIRLVITVNSGSANLVAEFIGKGI